MKLSITANGQEKENLIVEMNGQRQHISSEHNKLEFIVDDPGKYTLRIYEEMKSKKVQIADIIWYIITWLFRGVFNIIFMNTETKEWAAQSNRIYIEANMEIELTSDQRVDFIYEASKYISKTERWSFPKLKMEQPYKLTTMYKHEVSDIKRQFYSFLRDFLSVETVALGFFSFLFYCVVKRRNTDVAVLVGLVIFILIVALIYTLVIEYKKLQTIVKKEKVAVFLRKK